MAVLSRWEQAKELMIVSYSPRSPHMFAFAWAGASQRLPGGCSEWDPTSSRYVQSNR